MESAKSAQTSDSEQRSETGARISQQLHVFHAIAKTHGIENDSGASQGTQMRADGDPDDMPPHRSAAVAEDTSAAEKDPPGFQPNIFNRSSDTSESPLPSPIPDSKLPPLQTCTRVRRLSVPNFPYNTFNRPLGWFGPDLQFPAAQKTQARRRLFAEARQMTAVQTQSITAPPPFPALPISRSAICTAQARFEDVAQVVSKHATAFAMTTAAAATALATSAVDSAATAATAVIAAITNPEEEPTRTPSPRYEKVKEYKPRWTIESHLWTEPVDTSRSPELSLPPSSPSSFSMFPTPSLVTSYSGCPSFSSQYSPSPYSSSSPAGSVDGYSQPQRSSQDGIPDNNSGHDLGDDDGFRDISLGTGLDEWSDDEDEILYLESGD